MVADQLNLEPFTLRGGGPVGPVDLPDVISDGTIDVDQALDSSAMV